MCGPVGCVRIDQSRGTSIIQIECEGRVLAAAGAGEEPGVGIESHGDVDVLIALLGQSYRKAALTKAGGLDKCICGAGRWDGGCVGSSRHYSEQSDGREGEEGFLHGGLTSFLGYNSDFRTALCL